MVEIPWFKVDDKLHDHRKARSAGVAALGLWTVAGSWCADNLMDGFVPASVASRWDRNYEKLAAKLVEVGLWSEVEVDGEAGWGFHEWERYQPTREKVLAQREAARERVARARSSAVRANTERTSDGVALAPTRPVPYPPKSPRANDVRPEMPLARDVMAAKMPNPSEVVGPPPSLRRNGSPVEISTHGN